jgi:outer membrane protein OmpA-like peptidoglycan-associated protein
MAKQIKYSYYRGQFRSQFSLGDYTDYSNGRRKLHEVVLEPKFQLFNATAISVDEFEKQIRCNTVVSKCECYLHSIKDFHVVRVFERDFIEVYPGAETKGGKYLHFDSFAAFYTYDGLRTNSGIGGFYAKEGKSGKFTGEGFVRVIENEELIKEAIVQKVKADTLINKVVSTKFVEQSKGCFNRKANSIGGSVVTPQQSNGCFNRRLPFGGAAGIGGPSTAGGCFNAAQQPGGCFSMGWLGRILGLLGLLALLLYLLSMLRNCERASGDQVVYIHDTIVVEVIKERVDTLEVVRIDTAKFLQTNKVETTDMVSLPNVQFETDKDILVPGSLPDIQKLAEFLNKKEQIKAVIMGHTDSVGDFKHNMDLSSRRARAVKDMLVRLGVESSRIDSKGFGPTQPKASNSTLEGRLMNRRVEVKLTNTVIETEGKVERVQND